MAGPVSGAQKHAYRCTYTQRLLKHNTTDDHLQADLSIPSMWAVTGLINNEAHRAYTSWISLRVLYLLLRAAKRGCCEIKRLIYLPAAKPQWLSSP